MELFKESMKEIIETSSDDSFKCHVLARLDSTSTSEMCKRIDFLCHQALSTATNSINVDDDEELDSKEMSDDVNDEHHFNDLEGTGGNNAIKTEEEEEENKENDNFNLLSSSHDNDDQQAKLVQNDFDSIRFN